MARILSGPSIAARSNRAGYPLKKRAFFGKGVVGTSCPDHTLGKLHGTPGFRICRAPPSYGCGNGVYSDGNEDGASAPFRSRRRP